MADVYLSYRRSDTAAQAAAVHATLTERAGLDVFLDVESLALGASFRDAIETALTESSVVLALVGHDWNSVRPDGRRRLDDPDDWVRHELVRSLEPGKVVIPVLFDVDWFEALDGIPVELDGLRERQAIRVRSESWSKDIVDLAERIDGLVRPSTARPETTAPPVSAPSTHRFDVPPATETFPPSDPPGPAVERTPFRRRLIEAFRVLRGHADDPAGRLRSPAEDRRPIDEYGTVEAAPTAEPSSATQPVDAPRGGHDVFISHSSDDAEFAQSIVRALERDRCRCWIAPRDIPPGSRSWSGPIVAAIASSRLLLVLLTEHSNASVDVLREVTLADDEDIPMLPVSLDATPLSPDLRYFFATGQRLELIDLAPDEQLAQIPAHVTRNLDSELDT